MDNRRDTSVASRGTPLPPAGPGKVDSSMAVPSQHVSAVGASSQVATRASMTALASFQSRLPTVKDNNSESRVDQQGQVEISELMNSIINTVEKAAEAADSTTRLEHLQHIIYLVEEAIGLPVPTDIGQAVDKARHMQRKKVRRRLQKTADSLDGRHPDVKHLRNLNSRLFKRWDLERKFRFAHAACDGLLSGPTEDHTDQQLAEVEAFLQDSNPDEIKDFLPANAITTWLESAATRLGSGVSRDRLKVSNLMLDLKRKLEGLLPPVTGQATEDHEKQTDGEEDAQKQPHTQTNKQETAGEGIQEAAKASNRSPIEQSSMEYDGPPGQGIGQGNDHMEGPEQHQHQETHICKGPSKDSTSLNPHQPPHLDSDNSSLDNTAQRPSASEPQSLDQRPGSEERASSDSFSEIAEMNTSDKGRQG